MMQATVRSFDPATGSGSVFLDDGTVAGFGAAAFAGSGLRLLRPGQRVAIGCDSGGAIVSLTLATFPLPGAAGRDARPAAGQDAERAVGQDAEPAAGQDAEPAAGQDAEPAAGPGAPPGTAGQDPAPG